MNLIQLNAAFELGLIYALVAIGVYITFRVIDFPDLTVDGSFTLGAALSAILLVKGHSPLLATSVAVVGGALAGWLTGYLHTRWHILGLLASILVMTALYSVNLRLMSQPNIALLNENTIFTNHSILFLTSVIVLLLVSTLIWFFNTHFGLALRASGINSKVCHAYGINTNQMKIIALMLSNAIVALSGALFAQAQGFADISMGTGTIITGLAAVILGESLFSPRFIVTTLLACIIGSLLYRIAIVFALNADNLGLLPSDLNLITTAIVAMTLIIPKIKSIKVSYDPETKNIHVHYNNGMQLAKHVLKGIDLTVSKGEFITIIGGNGHGKSTLMNILAGTLLPTKGEIFVNEQNITQLLDIKRAPLIARIFQDPLLGTFANLTVEENMAIALKRGKKRGLCRSLNHAKRSLFKNKLGPLGLNLEKHLKDKVSILSGGQRQALSLVMATLQNASVLLLDEHTAALDPKTAQTIMELTQQIIKAHNLTALMITHSLTQALDYGDRLLVIKQGKITHDFCQKQKHISVTDLMQLYETDKLQVA